MELAVNIHRLSLFGIPDGNMAGDVGLVRKILARLLETDSISLAELQTARDIVKKLDDVRAEAYLFLAAMFLSLHGGNTFLRPEKGVALLDAGGYLDPPGDGEYSNAGYHVDVQETWPEAVRAAKPIQGEFVIKRLDIVGECWFFQRNAVAVDAVSAGLSERADEQDGCPGLSSDELADAIAFKNFELNDEQVKAVKTAVSRMFTVVTGGPGTGKTTIVCAILRALMKRGLAPEEIALAAPTGRAAQRMGEALCNQCVNARDLDEATRTQIEALNGCTIHSLLGGFPPNWKYTADNKLPLKLVVVDESSMVDIHLMKALVAALPSDCRLVLLGDKDQLPTVEAGAVLGDIVGGEGVSCVVRLEKSNRFTGALAECAAAIKDGNAQKFVGSSQMISPNNAAWLDAFDEKGTENACFRYALGGTDRRTVCHEGLVRWAEHYGLLSGGELVRLASDRSLKDDLALTGGVNSQKAHALFAALDRSRVLTVVRQGPFGVQGVNDLLVMKRFGGRMPVNPLEKPGVPVIVTRNTPARNLWNGDVGVTVEGRSGIVVIFPRGDKVVNCPVGLLPEHELAYAMTVHKSQGSEFENVMVVLPDDEKHPLLNRQIVYTGITRAKKRAVIVGTDGALMAALSRKIERDTGISIAVEIEGGETK